MRGAFVDQGRLFSYISPEARVHGSGNLSIMSRPNASLASLCLSKL